jgi:predicted pyridoxine 5'-phosphate oxidase superfamily flavin-nucleotide-binding protein
VTIALRDLAAAMEGLIPPAIATCSAAGEPNLTYVSSVQVLDDDHVVVSNQFFGKTVANLDENPRAAVLVQDAETGRLFCVRMRLVRRETDGPVFEELSARIDAIAAMMGMEAVFKLRSADIFAFDRCEALE